MRVTLSLVVALLALPAFADAPLARSARLLDDAPVAAGSPAPASLMPASAKTDDALTRPTYGVHFSKTFAVGVAGTALGNVLGGLLPRPTNNLAGALLGVMLPNLIVGPLVTVVAAVLIGNDGGWRGGYSFWGPFLAAFGWNLVQYLVTSLFVPVAITSPVAVLVYSLIDGLVMTGGSVGVMHLTGPAPQPAAATVTSFVPGVTDTQVVSMSKVEF